MKVLVINSGSSSIKYQLFEMPRSEVIARGLLEKIGEEISPFRQKSGRGEVEIKTRVPDHEAGLNLIIRSITDPETGVVASRNEIAAVGHRVVHGGEEFTGSVLITPRVMAKIRKYADLAPLHNPPNLMGIRAARKFLPGAVQTASFDTAFHTTIPDKAALYAIPHHFYHRYRIKRYGFHGTSHRYVARRLAEILKRDKTELNLITCHLGNGCSITAIEQGRSVDTSMGLTPLEGLVMGTRSGDLDPAIIFYLADKGYNPKEINNILNKQSGLLGLSGQSNDMRNLVALREGGDPRAALAIDIFCYRLRKYLGAYLAVLGRTDAIIFTGGIGENNPLIRTLTLQGLEGLGIRLDEKRNRLTRAVEGEISAPGAPIRVYIIPTNEELRIAGDAYEIASRRPGNAIGPAASKKRRRK
ncbi:MAG TPA: acetate kinase [bacterium]|uniref:Acetate kinase n=1 Tax=candidate division TA06 bacterium ADurb.Bin417 TaxID=1852828 RepID=A0A1V5MHG5_UNCT6|nr:MAG: Acetate kinase [candidate division TA06 bacterium ADurb.Bin417]HNQ35451.1 acetate kinase [bacterium]HNS48841.1 acetate kinase [bacterium]